MHLYKVICSYTEDTPPYNEDIPPYNGDIITYISQYLYAEDIPNLWVFGVKVIPFNMTYRMHPKYGEELEHFVLTYVNRDMQFKVKKRLPFGSVPLGSIKEKSRGKALGSGSIYNGKAIYLRMSTSTTSLYNTWFKTLVYLAYTNTEYSISSIGIHHDDFPHLKVLELKGHYSVNIEHMGLLEITVVRAKNLRIKPSDAKVTLINCYPPYW